MTFLRRSVKAFAGGVSDAAETLTVKGRALARAHAKAGDALMIGGHLGSKDAFVEAVGDFALAYADQTERDHADLKAVVRGQDRRTSGGINTFPAGRWNTNHGRDIMP